MYFMRISYYRNSKDTVGVKKDTTKTVTFLNIVSIKGFHNTRR